MSLPSTCYVSHAINIARHLEEVTSLEERKENLEETFRTTENYRLDVERKDKREILQVIREDRRHNAETDELNIPSEYTVGLKRTRSALSSIALG